MKNTIYVDIDTDREKNIIFGKPPEIPQPQNRDEMSRVVLNDIAGLAEALTTLILMADQNGYGAKGELVAACVKTIYSLLENSEPQPF